MLLYRLAFGRTCPLLDELEHRAYRAAKELNVDIQARERDSYLAQQDGLVSLGCIYE